jgi:hypothetical protein
MYSTKYKAGEFLAAKISPFLVPLFSARVKERMKFWKLLFFTFISVKGLKLEIDMLISKSIQMIDNESTLIIFSLTER